MSNLFVPVDRMMIPASAAFSKEVPDWFLRAMRDIDPALIVYWNPIRKRFILDRCTAAGVHSAADHTHTPECPRTNVKIVQGVDGEFMPLCESVLEWLRKNDTWNNHGSAEMFVGALATQDAQYQQKLAAERRDNTHRTTLENRRQLLKMKHLADQHSLKINQ
jgi:hypothetical protein